MSSERRAGSEVTRLKPHHFVDIITSFGRGVPFTPHPYGHALHSVAERIVADRDALIEVELGADDICGPCVHNVGGACDDTIDTSFRPAAPASKEAWNRRLDRRWSERLGLRPGDRLTARTFCAKLRDQLGRMGEVYREMPADHTASRSQNLATGIRRFLEDG